MPRTRTQKNDASYINNTLTSKIENVGKDNEKRTEDKVALEKPEKQYADVSLSLTPDLQSHKPRRGPDKGQFVPDIQIKEDNSIHVSSLPEQEAPASQITTKNDNSAEGDPTPRSLEEINDVGPLERTSDVKPHVDETTVHMHDTRLETRTEPTVSAENKEPDTDSFNKFKGPIADQEAHGDLPEIKREQNHRLHTSESQYTNLDTAAKARLEEKQSRNSNSLSLSPANPNKRTRYSPPPVRQSEETIVTINIGRIEVRAEPPAKPARVPRRRFTPALSLADYLKQRSEGKSS